MFLSPKRVYFSNPYNDNHEPEKEEVVLLLNYIKAMAENGFVTVGTLAELQAITNKDDYTPAQVTGDPLAGNNGQYYWLDDEWVRIGDIEASIAVLNQTNADANDIVAVPERGDVDLGATIFVFVPTATNTGGMRLNIDGGWVDLRVTKGVDAIAGDVIQGRQHLIHKDGAEYIISTGLTTTDKAVVVAAKTTAETAAASAALFDANGINFETVGQFFTNTNLTYTTGQTGSIIVGDYVYVRVGGYVYEVVSSTATDHHFSINNVKYKAVAGSDGAVTTDQLNRNFNTVNIVLAQEIPVKVSPGITNIDTQVLIPRYGAFFGSGLNCILKVIGDINPIRSIGAHTLIEHFQLINTQTNHTSNGIEVGNDDNTQNGGRTAIRGVIIKGMGNDGIQWRSGNAGTIEDVVCLSNGRDGINGTDESIDNLVVNLAGNVDLRGNGRHGLCLEGGTGSTDNHAARCWTGTVMSQENGGIDVLIESAYNDLRIYAEDPENPATTIKLTSISKGNNIVVLEGNVIDEGQDNQVLKHKIGTVAGRNYMNILASQAGFKINNASGIAGEMTLYKHKTADAKFWAMFGGSGKKQELRFKNTGGLANPETDKPKYPINLYLDGGVIARRKFNFANGDTTPDVSLSENWLANNTGAITLTTFNGGVDGQVIYIRFNNNHTTITHTGSGTSGIKLKDGVDKTYSQNDVGMFFRLGIDWWVEL